MAEARIPADARVSYRQEYRRCGKEGCAICAPGKPGHGPYWYASWREQGRRYTRYLGRQTPPGMGKEASGAPTGAAEARDPGMRAGLPAATAAPFSEPPATTRPTASEPAGRAPLRVRVLGAFAVWRDGVLIPAGAWGGRRAAALLKCLLAAPGYRLHREQAADLLWPEADAGTAAANLRTTVALLRRVLDGPPGTSPARSHLRAEGEVLALEPSGVGGKAANDWLDAAAFERAAERALAGHDPIACREALALDGGEYLPEDRYEPWAGAPRERLRRLREDLLLHLAALAAAAGELGEAEGCLRRVLAADPCQEAAAARLMGLLAAGGRRAEALRTYQGLAAALEDELGLAPSDELEALRARLLAQAAAPPAVAPAPVAPSAHHPTNVPTALTSFVGRDWELAELAGVLGRVRLVTLTGIGGCGKTRLALETAVRTLGDYPDGAWLVELATTAEPALVPQAMADALSVDTQQAGPDRSLPGILAEFLRSRHLLLVLDNCEHLLDACATLVATLLRDCPGLRVLATSRARLNVPGEVAYRVPSLAMPDPDHLPTTEGLSTYEAVRLFEERAAAHMSGRGTRLDLREEATARAVARICARLDGLPLAIELATARLSSMSVEAVATRLDDRFRLLTGGPRTALPRQQTLRAALDWSYGLLPLAEQALLRRLSVFAGDWTLEAAEAVCAGEGIPDGTVMDLVATLVDQSLVECVAEEDRYRLLETVRQYAHERLTAVGEDHATQDRHLAWCVALAEEAEPGLSGPEQATWLTRLDAEHDNLRAALRWSLAGDGSVSRSGAGLQLAGALWRFWYFRGHYGEGRAWLERTRMQAPDAPTAFQARAYNGAGNLAYIQGDYAAAQAFHEQALAARRASGDRKGVSISLVNLGAIAMEQGGHARAQALFEESAALKREVGDRLGLGIVLGNLGMLATRQGAYRRAEELHAESLAIAREVDDKWNISAALSGVAEAAYMLGDRARARAIFEEELALERELGATQGIAIVLGNLGNLAIDAGEHERAGKLYRESLTLYRQLGDQYRIALSLPKLAALALAEGQPRRAVWLIAAAEGLRRTIDARFPDDLQQEIQELLRQARGALDEATVVTAWASGHAATLEQAVATALERPSART